MRISPPLPLALLPPSARAYWQSARVKDEQQARARAPSGTTTSLLPRCSVPAAASQFLTQWLLGSETLALRLGAQHFRPADRLSTLLTPLYFGLLEHRARPRPHMIALPEYFMTYNLAASS